MDVFASMRWESWMVVLAWGLQVTAVLSFCWFLAAVMRRRSTAVAHLVWSVGLFAVLIIPLLIVTPKPWSIPIATRVAAEVPPSVARATGPGSNGALEIDRVDLPVSEASPVSLDSAPTFRSEASSSPHPSEAGALPVHSLDNVARSGYDWLPRLVFSFWILGTCLLLLRIMAAAWCLRAAVRNSRLADDRINKSARDWAANLGLTRRFEIRLAPVQRMPIAFWWAKWIVVLPASAKNWDDDMLNSVLAHELGHILRRDAITDLVGQLACAAYWFHPMVWFAAAALRRLREQACDDLVLYQAALAPKAYAKHLLDVVSECVAARNQLASAISSSSNVETRIRRILDDSIRPLAKMPSLFLRRGVTGVILVSAILVSAFQFTFAQEKSAADARMHEHYVFAAGSVVDDLGKPVRNADVVLRIIPALFDSGTLLQNNPDVMARSKTDAQGAFVFEEVEVPEPFRTKYQSIRRPVFEVVATNREHGISATKFSNVKQVGLEIKLAKRESLFGRIVNAQGQPVSSARVKVTAIFKRDAPIDGLARGPSDLNFSFSQISPTSLSDEKGEFRIDGLPVDSIIACLIEHGDHPNEYVRFSIGPDAKTHTIDARRGPIEVFASRSDVSLKDGYKAETTVVDHNGEPLDAHIRFEGSARVNFMVGSKGRYAVAVPSTGEHYLTAVFSGSHLTYREKTMVTKENRARPIKFDVRMPKTRIAHGMVVDDVGKPVANIRVGWADEKFDDNGNAKGRFGSHATTDKDGRYQIELVPGGGHMTVFDGGNRSVANGVFIPGRFTAPKGTKRKQQAIQVAVSGEADLKDLVVSRGLVVSGVVKDSEGKPIANAQLEAFTSENLYPRRGSVLTDANGRYELAGLNPHCTYQIRVTGSSEVANLSVEKDESHAIDQTRLQTRDIATDPSGVTVVGRVVHDGKPLADMPIELKVGHTKDRRTSFVKASSARTDENGRYRLPGVRPGEKYQIEIDPPFPAIAPGWRHQRPYSVTIPSDAGKEYELDELNLLRMSQSVAGKVIDPEGNPIEGVSVSASMVDGRNLSRTRDLPTPWTKTNDKGEFRLTHLPSEPVKLMAYIRPKKGNRIKFPASVTPEPNQEDIEIVLDPSLHEE